MKQPGSASDPLWYKDAIIYELHVKAFMDSNNDGIGDFQGLLSRLDYVQDLGVTCLWLLPFFPSPLRDDGYDISDYLSVHPNYGTMDDFREFLTQAHNRGLQVMIELVINHTSDQHPWFQRARLAPKGSPERDFYVWSDSDEKYSEARIIFTDTEKSNWTWDPEAQQYYWHRFFSHQPDLNYDNPVVIEEVVKVMHYWLDMGVDGLRVDAIPYLVEREGTNCENLPETHAVMKRIRAEIDAKYAARTILAEANQWPADVRIYYGDGDECHMAFHFPLMPRMYMALRQEDRLPIVDIMAQTPEIPNNCQWGLFLRNHDELTLEMVTDEERDYMYLAYSADPRMRINVGIRRRLAPLVDNSRRRIELLNSLLFSFPGTPIVYYGDEIGMGDNIYLGDRNGVRTPMQWSGDRNAGFSRAVPAKLYSPVVMDPVWGYEAINVEAQQSDPSSLLSWMRNMIALRKLFQVFGRGSLTFLNPVNRKILAYIREYQNERVLCVANLSRFAQPVELDLAQYAGMVPVEMLGYVEFPRIRTSGYPLTVGPYGFLWLELQPSPELAPVQHDDGEPELELNAANDWMSVLEGKGRRELEETVLRAYVVRQRWFGGKSRVITGTKIEDWAVFNNGTSALAFIGIQYADGESDTYLVTLGLLFGRAADALREESPNALLARVVTSSDMGVLHEAVFNDSASEALLAIIAGHTELPTRDGLIQGMPSTTLSQLQGTVARHATQGVGRAKQYLDHFWRPPDHEAFPQAAVGSQSRYGDRQLPYGISTLLPHRSLWRVYPVHAQRAGARNTRYVAGLVSNEGDGWGWTLEELDRYFEASAAELFSADGLPTGEQSLLQLSQAQETRYARDHVGTYLDAAALLGKRTAELHLALAQPTTDSAFAPEPLSVKDIDALRVDLIQHAANAFDALKANVAKLPDTVLERAGLVMSRRTVVLDRLRQLATQPTDALRTRIHGDYHLGQVLRSKGDFVILDFEGEPARSLAERRTKQSPLKDVAGMLRSFSYAAFSALIKYSTRRPEDFSRLEPWAKLWEQSVSSAFLRTYCESVKGVPVIPSDPQQFAQLLEAFVIDKALYELTYELNNRPNWVVIPLTGILAL